MRQLLTGVIVYSVYPWWSSDRGRGCKNTLLNYSITAGPWLSHPSSMSTKHTFRKKKCCHGTLANAAHIDSDTGCRRVSVFKTKKKTSQCYEMCKYVTPNVFFTHPSILVLYRHRSTSISLHGATLKWFWHHTQKMLPVSERAWQNCFLKPFSAWQKNCRPHRSNIVRLSYWCDAESGNARRGCKTDY